MNFGIETPTSDVFNKYVQDNYVKELKKDDKKVFLDLYDRKIGILNMVFNYWKVFKYDSNGNQVFVQDSEGNWEKRKYKDGNIIQFSNSSGTHWVKNNF